MKYSRSIVSLGLLASLGIGAAFAQPQPQADSGSGAPAFSELSKGEKYIKRGDVPKDVEALKQLRAHFPEADLNHDGKLDQTEYETYVNKGSQPQQNR